MSEEYCTFTVDTVRGLTSGQWSFGSRPYVAVCVTNVIRRKSSH